jgi:hypothetical protein
LEAGTAIDIGNGMRRVGGEWIEAYTGIVFRNNDAGMVNETLDEHRWKF